MSAIVRPFLVRYEGRDADNGILESTSLSESIAGASGLYNAVAHYCVFGTIPRGRYRKRLTCYARAAQPGSWDQAWEIITNAAEVSAALGLTDPVVGYAFERVVDYMKMMWVSPRRSSSIAKEGADGLGSGINIFIQAPSTLNLNVDNGKAQYLQNSLPILAQETRHHGKKLVSPVGKSCDRIIQFPNSMSSSISDLEAQIIRRIQGEKLEEMQEYFVNRINGIDLKSGRCDLEVVIEDNTVSVLGKITDPSLQTPNNVYTKAVNDHSGCLVQAKAVRIDGELKRLYISDAKPIPEYWGQH